MTTITVVLDFTQWLLIVGVFTGRAYDFVYPRRRGLIERLLEMEKHGGQSTLAAWKP